MAKSFESYRAAVLACIDRKIGGKRGFEIDELGELSIRDSFTKKHLVSVVAVSLIREAVAQKKSEADRAV